MIVSFSGFDPVIRYRDAIECLRRALIPAGEDQVGIVLKLADLHHLLGDWAAESAYHRRVVHMCTLAGQSLKSLTMFLLTSTVSKTNRSIRVLLPTGCGF